jgi:hypothetical protein
MPVSGIAHRAAVGNFSNIVQESAGKPAVSQISRHLNAVVNDAEIGFYKPDITAREWLDQNPESRNTTHLVAHNVFQAALIMLYAQQSLGATPNSPFLSQLQKDSQNSNEHLLHVPDQIVAAGNRQIASAAPFIGVNASPEDQSFLLVEENSVASSFQQLGNNLMLTGALGMVRRNAAPLAAVSTIAGLGILSVASYLNTPGEPSPDTSSPTDITHELANIRQPDGKTLDQAVRDAIHACAGNSRCEHEAVLRVVAPYLEQIDLKHHASSSKKGLSGVVSPLSEWAALVEEIIDAYHHLDERSFMADIKAIADAPTNNDRREVIVELLKGEGCHIDELGFDRKAPDWLTGRAQILGVNVICHATSNTFETDVPLVVVCAHADRTEEGSGALDDGSGSAVLIELYRRFAADPPEGNCRIKLAFFAEEETGLNGSKEFVKECLEEGDCKKDGDSKSIFINVDMVGSGSQIYAGSSNASHHWAIYSDDPVAARKPRPEDPLETQFLNGLRETSQETGLTVVQNGGTMASDELSAQFEGLAAVGLTLLEKNQPNEMARLSRAMREFDLAFKDYKPTAMEEARAALDVARAKGYRSEVEIAQRNYNATIDSHNAYVAGFLELERATAANSVAWNIHNKNDTLETIRPEDGVRFINVLENGIRKLCAKL